MRVWRIQCVNAMLLNVNVREREYALYIVCRCPVHFSPAGHQAHVFLARDGSARHARRLHVGQRNGLN